MQYDELVKELKHIHDEKNLAIQTKQLNYFMTRIEFLSDKSLNLLINNLLLDIYNNPKQYYLYHGLVYLLKYIPHYVFEKNDQLVLQFLKYFYITNDLTFFVGNNTFLDLFNLFDLFLAKNFDENDVKILDEFIGYFYSYSRYAINKKYLELWEQRKEQIVAKINLDPAFTGYKLAAYKREFMRVN